MDRQFTTSKTKAIKVAKEILKNIFGVKRLKYYLIKNSSASCGCGETFAVYVLGWRTKDGKIESTRVGVCKVCNNN